MYNVRFRESIYGISHCHVGRFVYLRWRNFLRPRRLFVDHASLLQLQLAIETWVSGGRCVAFCRPKKWWDDPGNIGEKQIRINLKMKNKKQVEWRRKPTVKWKTGSFWWFPYCRICRQLQRKRISPEFCWGFHQPRLSGYWPRTSPGNRLSCQCPCGKVWKGSLSNKDFCAPKTEVRLHVDSAVIQLETPQRASTLVPCHSRPVLVKNFEPRWR